jgi:hypothetical protein
VSQEAAYSASYWELFAPAAPPAAAAAGGKKGGSSKGSAAKAKTAAAAEAPLVGVEWIDVDDVVGKCVVAKPGQAAGGLGGGGRVQGHGGIFEFWPDA